MSKIDYSKWDKIELSSEDENNVDLNSSNLNCRVTKFETPQKITINGSDKELIGDERLDKSNEYLCINNENEQDFTKKELFISKDKDPKIEDYVWCRSSKTGHEYGWTQNGNEVKLLIPIEESVPSKEVSVLIENNKILVKAKNNAILSEEFEYEINNSEDCTFWSIIKPNIEKSNHKNKKMIFIELEKKKLDSTIRIWWKSAFKGGPETIIDKFRKLSEKETDRNTKFKEVWKKAHEEFKKNIKNKRINLI
ncbi:nuclear move domain protein [Cryptosporidium ryanae]|uniref:nuclear move domain protein n=1 Tax=Cryptosporidium ryanae TaxID=515981 RepID=UPI00351A2E0E|nr:nuclear move domain protein [Cryptosporidium ryanae]